MEFSSSAYMKGILFPSLSDERTLRFSIKRKFFNCFFRHVLCSFCLEACTVSSSQEHIFFMHKLAFHTLQLNWISLFKRIINEKHNSWDLFANCSLWVSFLWTSFLFIRLWVFRSFTFVNATTNWASSKYVKCGSSRNRTSWVPIKNLPFKAFNFARLIFSAINSSQIFSQSKRKISTKKDIETLVTRICFWS